MQRWNSLWVHYLYHSLNCGVKSRMEKRLVRKSRTGKDKFFYFNVADESHAKILDRTQKQDPMKLIHDIVEIDEY